MNICIVGGGNIGTAMGAYIKSTNEHKLTYKTSNPSKWSNTITYVDKESQNKSVFVIDCITSDSKQAYSDADVIMITLPSFMIGTAINEMKPFLKTGAMVGVIPGSGGCEFYAKELIKEGIVFFGMDRVPCVSRLLDYGHVVQASKKVKSRAVAVPNKYTQKVADTLASILHMEIEPLKNYLTVTFTPSNPLVHTARLYAMFKDADKDTILDSQILFYGEWDDKSSDILFRCDDELHAICDALDELDLSGVIRLCDHYEQYTVPDLTKKIRSITSMNAILSPLEEFGDKFKLDLKSRYFIEDWPYGLCIIKGFAVIVGVETPMIDTVIRWYEKLVGKEYFVDNEFIGKDIAETSIPQNFGIKTREDVYNFYK